MMTMVRSVELEDVCQPCEWRCEACGHLFLIGESAYRHDHRTRGGTRGVLWLCRGCSVVWSIDRAAGP